MSISAIFRLTLQCSCALSMLIGCSSVTPESFLDAHPETCEGIAFFEGFHSTQPDWFYYCLCIDSLHRYPHIRGCVSPVANHQDDSYNGLTFKAYYDSKMKNCVCDGISSHDFWVCMDELILPQSSSLIGFSLVRLSKVVISQGYSFVKYYIKGYDDEGQEGTIACEEHLPLELLDKLKQCKRDNQAVWVSIYTNPINPKRPIIRIIRESIGNADEYRRFLTQE